MLLAALSSSVQRFSQALVFALVLLSAEQVKSMLRFFPVMGLEDELDERDGGGNAHEHPVQRNQKGPFHQAVLLAPDASDQIGVEKEKIAKDEAGSSKV